jgi:UDP-3-O-[3-hydroxymyristoyl] glucosamine N-acyltransferase
MRTNRVQNHQSTYALKELAERFEAAVRGDSETRISGVESLQDAGSGQLSFVTASRLRDQAMGCKASALIVPPALDDLPFPLLVHPNPYLLFARIAQLFHTTPLLNEGIHPTACVSEEADLAHGVRIGPMVHVGPSSRIGTGSSLYAGVHIGAGVELGENCLIHPGVTILDRCRIGNRVIIHSGAVIGSDGFGYVQDEIGRHVKIPQSGFVQVDDDVEIGSNCCIDRATFDRTWIQRGAKIDNLVQIAHNVIVGEYSILVAQVGISGSTRLGRHVILAGQVGLADHIEIGDGVRIGAKSGVAHSIKAGQDMIGIPAMPQKQWFKTLVHLQRLSQYRDEIKVLQKKVHELETRLNEEK